MGFFRLALVPLLLLSSGCMRATPSFGSVGLPQKGYLAGGTRLTESANLHFFHRNDRQFGIPRFTHAIERAAVKVARERPGAPLVTGDLSAQRGGHISGHASHRTGRDADLLLYFTTLEGAPVTSPGFLSVDADGLAWDHKSGRFLRFDVEREWLLIKALVEDDDARAQWLFVSEALEAMIVEWARARGDDPEMIARAQEIMWQPTRPASPHDDHVHLRAECSKSDVFFGCEHYGPRRAWHHEDKAVEPETVADLVSAIARPIHEAYAAR